MRFAVVLLLLLVFAWPFKAAFAQTAWPPLEPSFPPVCSVLRAGVSGQPTLQDALVKCPPGQAVEMSAGPDQGQDNFVIDPVRLPKGVSLIVDGGVTLYGTSDASKYQTPKPAGWSTAWVCGTVGTYPITGPCRALITLSRDNGVYGYGIIDGQGDKPVIVNGVKTESWWYLITRTKKDCKPASGDAETGKPCQEASPPMISIGYNETNSRNLVLYKITLRNPPYHVNRLEGSYITIWGVKVQAPWNVPNTDGFDLRGDHILVKDSIVANGDQDIALGSADDSLTRNVDIEGLRAYAKGGIAFLTEGSGFKDIDIDDFAMTGDVPSFVLGAGKDEGSVNGVSDAEMFGLHKVHFYQALPSATHDTQGMQIFAPATGVTAGRKVRDITFSKVCIADVVWPMNLTTGDQPALADDAGSSNPIIGPILYQKIHVLPPGPQSIEPDATAGKGWKAEKYQFVMDGNAGTPNRVTLDNFVFGNGEPPGMLFDALSAQQNRITAVTNVYPDLFNRLDQPLAQWSVKDNRYRATATRTTPNLAYPCAANLFPFLTGELYAGLGSDPEGSDTNLQRATVMESSMVTLYAVVQPTMSQTSYYVPDSYGADPGLFAIGSPRLKGEVMFYDNGSYIGNGKLGANGTLATLTIDHIGAGNHNFTAAYTDPPGADFYSPLSFGNVAVTVTE